jgi:hypothetical protein
VSFFGIKNYACPRGQVFCFLLSCHLLASPCGGARHAPCHEKQTSSACGAEAYERSCYRVGAFSPSCRAGGRREVDGGRFEVRPPAAGPYGCLARRKRSLIRPGRSCEVASSIATTVGRSSDTTMAGLVGSSSECAACCSPRDRTWNLWYQRPVALPVCLVSIESLHRVSIPKMSPYKGATRAGAKGIADSVCSIHRPAGFVVRSSPPAPCHCPG